LIEETIDLVLNNELLFNVAATLLGGAAAAAGGAFAIPSFVDRLQPPPIQSRLCDFLPFIKMMPDGKTIACLNNKWVRVIGIVGAELVLAPYQDTTGRGRAELFFKRKFMLDDLFKNEVDELRLFQVKSQHPVAPLPPNPIKVLDEVQTTWTGRFKSIFRMRTFLVVSVKAGDFDAANEKLDKACGFICNALADYSPRVLQEPAPGATPNYTPDPADLPLAALGALASPVSHPTPVGREYADRVSNLLTSDQISFTRNEKRGIIRFSNGRHDRFAIIIGIRDCGDKTSEQIMKNLLGLPIEMTIFQIVRPHDPTRDVAQLRIERSSAPLMRLSAGAAYEIDDVLTMVEGTDSSNRATLHDYALSIIVMAATPAECLEAEGHIQKEIGPSGATLVRENTSAQATWFSMFPADRMFPRTFRHLSSNIAANMFLQRPTEGFQTSNWAQRPICYFPTIDGQPYAFQFHAEPSDFSTTTMMDKETVAHAVSIGPTGAGKTALITFIASMAMSIPNLRIYLFDRLQGCEVMTNCSRGEYLFFERQNLSVQMNPFRQNDTPTNREFLDRWIRMIGGAEDAKDAAEVSRCIDTIFDPNLDDRHKSLAALYGSTFEAGGRMRKNLQQWVDPNLFGNFFNGAKDSLDLTTKRLIGFDMTTVLDNPDLAPAVIDYLIHRIRAVSIETQDPSLIFIDETAPMLQHARFARAFVEVGLREGRKRRSAFLLAFQTPQAIAATPIANDIRQQCQTAFFFRNKNAQRSDYADWNLTEGELDFILGKDHKEFQYAVLVKKYANGADAAHSVILNTDLRILGRYLKIYNSGAPAVAEARRAIDAYGINNFVEPYLNGEFSRHRSAN
jgi:type IV secretion system protein VirB4